MDKQSIISQLELDINALQRQVDEFKKHPENITTLEWELFVQRLQLMHQYCRQLKLNEHPETFYAVEEKKQPERMTIPSHEQEVPPVQAAAIVTQEVPQEKFEHKGPVEPVTKNEEIKEGLPAATVESAPAVTESKPSPQKQKKPTVSVGGLFGDMHSLADQFKDGQSVADKIAKSRLEKSVADKMQHKPVHDLKDAIGINEKFLFINELFDGNLQDYSEAVNKLNSSGDLKTAENMLNEDLAIRFNWREDSIHVKNFKDLVERRFS